jgi:hypothetical protein
MDPRQSPGLSLSTCSRMITISANSGIAHILQFSWTNS